MKIFRTIFLRFSKKYKGITEQCFGVISQNRLFYTDKDFWRFITEENIRYACINLILLLEFIESVECNVWMFDVGEFLFENIQVRKNPRCIVKFSCFDCYPNIEVVINGRYCFVYDVRHNEIKVHPSLKF